jgi:hypothetical protein
VIRPGLVTDVAIFPDRHPPPLPRFDPMCRLVVEPCRWTAGLGTPPGPVDGCAACLVSCCVEFRVCACFFAAVRGRRIRDRGPPPRGRSGPRGARGEVAPGHRTVLPDPEADRLTPALQVARTLPRAMREPGLAQRLIVLILLFPACIALAIRLLHISHQPGLHDQVRRVPVRVLRADDR